MSYKTGLMANWPIIGLVQWQLHTLLKVLIKFCGYCNMQISFPVIGQLLNCFVLDLPLFFVIPHNCS